MVGSGSAKACMGGRMIAKKRLNERVVVQVQRKRYPSLHLNQSTIYFV